MAPEGRFWLEEVFRMAEASTGPALDGAGRFGQKEDSYGKTS